MGSVTSVRVKWNLFFPFWRVFRKVHSMEKIHRWRDHLWFPCLYTALILGAAPSRYFWSSNCMEVTHLKDGEKRRHNFNYIFPITNRLISNTRKHLQMMDQSTDSFIWIHIENDEFCRFFHLVNFNGIRVCCLQNSIWYWILYPHRIHSKNSTARCSPDSIICKLKIQNIERGNERRMDRLAMTKCWEKLIYNLIFQTLTSL